MKSQDIERIAEMLDAGMTSAEIAETLEEERIATLEADYLDESDEGIARRYGISEDDRYDSRGEALLPKVNDAGEPYWM